MKKFVRLTYKGKFIILRATSYSDWQFDESDVDAPERLKGASIRDCELTEKDMNFLNEQGG